MKAIHLKDHLKARKGLSEETFSLYAKVECNASFKITRPYEEDDLEAFCHALGDVNDSLLDQYFLNFKIEQISKEFDLLRLGTHYLINIELKRDSTSKRIAKQLMQNQYYLSFIGKPVFSFTYISSRKALYKLEGNHIVKAGWHELINLLEKQEIWDIEDINTLFSPALFLVSPFTSPLKFLTNEYFLTDQQRMIKKEIIDAITNNQAIDLFSISGDYGTGKTLLIYDIAKSLKEYYDVVILHTMEEELIELSYLRSQGYNIKPLSCFHEVVKDADVIIIDEAQSLSQETFDMLLADQESCRIILSYDPYAFLIMSHALHHMKEQLRNHPNSRMFSLTHKIRTNKEMASFINHLFDLRKTENFMQYDHITCQYFSERADSAEFITRHQKAGFVLLEEGVVSSDLIMREYDQVMVIIDERFSYDEVGRLCADEESLMMLYQAITRVKKQLILIIINNEHLLKECVLLKMGSLESTYRRNK